MAVSADAPHPFLRRMRWVAGACLVVALRAYVSDLLHNLGNGNHTVASVLRVALLHPVLIFVIPSGVWLFTLFRTSRLTLLLTSLFFLLPYAWLVGLEIWFILSAVHVSGVELPALAWMMMWAGFIYLYHRSVWLWWLGKRREILAARV